MLRDCEVRTALDCCTALNHVGFLMGLTMASLADGTKRKLLKEVGYRCYYCGILLITDILTWDHVIPRSKGGTGSKKNMVACCRGCNGIKWDRSVPRFRDILELANQIESYVFHYEKIGLEAKGESHA